MSTLFFVNSESIRDLPYGVKIKTPEGDAICTGYSESRDRIRLVVVNEKGIPVERFYSLANFDIQDGKFIPLSHRSADVFGQGVEEAARKGDLI